MTQEKPLTAYDYKNQAWIVNGVYMRCGHPDSMNCGCFGKLHQGEKPLSWDEVEA